MARVVKEHEFALKRGEILDAAQRLVYSKGYERMTIQDILDDLNISKGAFYHYFDSKPAVLEALVGRMYGEVESLLAPIVLDAHLPALKKLDHAFALLARWKTTQKPLLLALLRIWYGDENAVFRQKVRATMSSRLISQLNDIMLQGIREGVVQTAYPAEIGTVALSLVIDLTDIMGRLLLAGEPGEVAWFHAQSMAAAYTDALERVLGAPTGSLTIVDTEVLKTWFLASSD